jgi:hypothetical protein
MNKGRKSIRKHSLVNFVSLCILFDYFKEYSYENVDFPNHPVEYDGPLASV